MPVSLGTLYEWLKDGSPLVLAAVIIAFLRGWIWPQSAVDRALGDLGRQIQDCVGRGDHLRALLDTANDELLQAARAQERAAEVANAQTVEALVRALAATIAREGGGPHASGL